MRPVSGSNNRAAIARASRLVLAVAAVGASTLPAAAQSVPRNVQSGVGVHRRAPRVGTQPGSQQYGYPGGAGGGYGYGHNPGTVITLPPEPLGPNSLGILERDFQYMRSTVRNPDQFLYGRWNPRYQVINPPPQYVPGNGYYYPPIYTPPGYVYGGFGGPNFYGGFGVPLQQNVVQRETIIIREGNGAGQPAPAPREEPRRESRSGDDFYLKGRPERAEASETVSDALDDIRKAWLNGDHDRLRARFLADGEVRVFPRGEYRYSVSAREFSDMLRDAMKRIDTLSFDLERPRSEEGGRVFVAGKHVFLDSEKLKQETHVSYVLSRHGGRWKIVEAGSSAEPIGRHRAPAPAEEEKPAARPGSREEK